MSAALFFHSPLYRTPEPVLPSYRNFHPRYPPPPPSPTIHTTVPPNSLTADTVANGRVSWFSPLFTLQKQTKTNARVCLSWNSSCEWLWSCWEPPPSHTHNKKPNPMLLTSCRMLFSLWSHLIVTVTSHFLPAVLCFFVFFLFESVLVFVNLVPGQDSRRIFIHILCVGGVSFWGAKSVLSSLANRQSVRTRFGRRFTGAKISFHSRRRIPLRERFSQCVSSFFIRRYSINQFFTPDFGEISAAITYADLLFSIYLQISEDLPQIRLWTSDQFRKWG